jgi:pyruvate dehydrogenase E1 component alpha subunit
MGTSVQRTSNVHDLSKLADAYEMPSESVDAMKVEDVHEATARAAELARKGGGPTLLEFKTYRYKGHSMSDPAKYRTKEEVEAYKRRDPIEQVKLSMKKYKFGGDTYFDSTDKKIRAEILVYVKFAEESDYPDPKEIFNDVYVQKNYPFVMD